MSDLEPADIWLAHALARSDEADVAKQEGEAAQASQKARWFAVECRHWAVVAELSLKSMLLRAGAPVNYFAPKSEGRHPKHGGHSAVALADNLIRRDLVTADLVGLGGLAEIFGDHDLYEYPAYEPSTQSYTLPEERYGTLDAVQEHRQAGSHILEIAKGYSPAPDTLKHTDTNLGATP